MPKRGGMNEATVRQAVTALLKHVEATKKGDFLGAPSVVSLIVALQRIPEKGSNKPKLIPLEHSLHPEGADMCLFVKSPVEPVREQLASGGVTDVKEVLALAKLRTDYSAYADKLRLLRSHDLFVADDRILPMLTKALGKKFFVRKRQPIPIRVSRGNLAEQIHRVRDSTFLFLGWGSCCAVKVGRTDFSVDQVVENIMAAMEAVVEHLPRKWKSIKGVQVKTEESVALPIFAQLEKLNIVSKAASSVAGKKRKAGEGEEKKATGKRKKAEEDTLDDDERRLLAGSSASNKRRRAVKSDGADKKASKTSKAAKSGKAASKATSKAAKSTAGGKKKGKARKARA